MDGNVFLFANNGTIIPVDVRNVVAPALHSLAQAFNEFTSKPALQVHAWALVLPMGLVAPMGHATTSISSPIMVPS